MKTEAQANAPALVYTVTEAAAILKVDEKTIRRLVARGLLKANRAIRHLRIPRQSIEQFVAKY